jgi:hypothetical protein
LSNLDDYRANARRALTVAEAWIVEIKASRDKREPGRRDKTLTELAIETIIKRVFRKQQKQVIDKAQYLKATPIVPGLDFEDDWDEGDEAELIAELTKAAKKGILLSGFSQIDPTIINVEAAKWARKYAGMLIKDLNSTTRSVLRDAVAMFVETPGFTIGDLMSMLPFSESRALSIAVTETTNAYAEGNRMAGLEMQKEFPDVPITKIWFTNNDDRVCDICGPLEGMEILLDEGFTTEDDKTEGLMGPAAHVNCRCWIEYSTRIT